MCNSPQICLASLPVFIHRFWRLTASKAVNIAPNPYGIYRERGAISPPFSIGKGQNYLILAMWMAPIRSAPPTATYFSSLLTAMEERMLLAEGPSK